MARDNRGWRRRAMAGLLLVLAGCGGGDGEVVLIDAQREDACPGVARLSSCNPLTQNGCSSGERCTFFHDGRGGVSHPGPCPNVGEAACVGAGTIALGEACVGPADEADGCQGGAFCADGACWAFCSVSPSSCDDGFTCVELATGSAQSLGTCQPTR